MATGGLLRLSVSATLAAALLVGALGGTGCGAESDRDRIEAAVVDVQDAFASGHLRDVCDGLTRAGRKHVMSLGHSSSGSCARDLRLIYQLVRDRDGGGRFGAGRELLSVNVQGKRAVARVSFGSSGSGLVHLTQEDGGWKVNGLWGGLPAERQKDKY
jgi:hypothetical protein